MSAAIQHIQKILQEEKRCQDAERLREIARTLQEYGQWMDARRVDNKAFEIEKRQASEAAR